MPIVKNTISNVANFISTTKEVLDGLPDLQDEQFKCEQAIRDIEHYVENNKVGRTQSVQLIRELKKYRIQRREIKDTIETLELLSNYFNERKEVWNTLQNRLGQARNIIKKVSTDRHYNPRVLYELFGQEQPKTSLSLAINKAKRC